MAYSHVKTGHRLRGGDEVKVVAKLGKVVAKLGKVATIELNNLQVQIRTNKTAADIFIRLLLYSPCN